MRRKAKFEVFLLKKSFFNNRQSLTRCIYSSPLLQIGNNMLICHLTAPFFHFFLRIHFPFLSSSRSSSSNSGGGVCAFLRLPVKGGREGWGENGGLKPTMTVVGGKFGLGSPSHAKPHAKKEWGEMRWGAICLSSSALISDIITPPFSSFFSTLISTPLLTDSLSHSEFPGGFFWRHLMSGTLFFLSAARTHTFLPLYHRRRCLPVRAIGTDLGEEKEGGAGFGRRLLWLYR